MTDTPTYIHNERAGRFLVDAIDALTDRDPETPKIRATFAARRTAWTGGDVTVPPGVYALLDGADSAVEMAVRREGEVVGRQAGMFTNRSST